MMGDPEVYRTKEEVAQAWENEPIKRLERRLTSLGHEDVDLTRVQAEADGVIADALEFAQSSPEPQPEDALTDVFA
jgi:pyruvate dehydrogenase E1 component alpha subunit